MASPTKYQAKVEKAIAKQDAKAAAADAKVKAVSIDWVLNYSSTFYFEINDSAFEASSIPDVLLRSRGRVAPYRR